MAIKKKIVIIFLFILIFLECIYLTYCLEVSIEYQAHLKDLGWIDVKRDGDVSGTIGESRRMEAIAISLKNDSGILSYQTHVEGYGWLPIVSDGIISGTVGESKRMEAVIIYLSNSSYELKYRVHVKDLGWMDWVKNGEMAGTVGQSRRIEAIQIMLCYRGIIIENKTIYNGIDVSKYQGDIDWKKVKKSGVDFAMIRAGYRGYTNGEIFEDKYFASNVKEAYDNNINVGLYFYSSALNEKEAIEEANFVIDLINKNEFSKKITYPIVIDIEDFEGARSFVLSKEERTKIVNEFCNLLRENGYIPMVYSYTYFLETYLNMDELKNIDVWIADYYGNTWYKRDFDIWQYTDEGLIDGIDGYVDLDYCYKKY